MSFINENLPDAADETSDFFRTARETLRLGYSKYDSWTVDREREMALHRTGSGREEGAGEEYWRFLTREGGYSLTTDGTSKVPLSAQEIAVKRVVTLSSSPGQKRPDAALIQCIREAFEAYKDWGVLSKYERCRFEMEFRDDGGRLWRAVEGVKAFLAVKPGK